MRLPDLQRFRPVIAVVLLAGTALLGVRVGAVAGEVSGHREGPTRHAAAPGTGRFERQAAAMDGRADLRRATAGPRRDPFRAPAPARVVRSDASTGEAATPAAPPPLPVVRALVFDNVSPAVQLAVGGRVSRWLGKGEAFQGWIVLEINPASVRVTNGNRQHELGMK